MADWNFVDTSAQPDLGASFWETGQRGTPEYRIDTAMPEEVQRAQARQTQLQGLEKFGYTGDEWWQPEAWQGGTVFEGNGTTQVTNPNTGQPENLVDVYRSRPGASGPYGEFITSAPSSVYQQMLGIEPGLAARTLPTPGQSSTSEGFMDKYGFLLPFLGAGAAGLLSGGLGAGLFGGAGADSALLTASGFPEATLGGGGLGTLGAAAADSAQFGLGLGGAPVTTAGMGATGGGLASLLSSPVGTIANAAKSILGDGKGGSLLNAAGGLAASIYGLDLADDQKKLAMEALQRSDPFAANRGMYADRLNALMANPSSITSVPGYDAGLQAVERRMAAQGFNGSGNMMTALNKYGGDFYNQEVARLMQLSGANATPGAGSAAAISGTASAADTASAALASLGYGAKQATGMNLPTSVQNLLTSWGVNS